MLTLEILYIFIPESVVVAAARQIEIRDSAAEYSDAIRPTRIVSPNDQWARSWPKSPEFSILDIWKETIDFKIKGRLPKMFSIQIQ